MVVPVIIALVGVLGAVASLTLFPGNAEKYSTILNTEDGDFATDIEQADYSTIPFIDRDSAVLLGNRTMGTMADYVSQFEISDLYSQINYRDAPVRVQMVVQPQYGYSCIRNCQYEHPGYPDCSS